MRGTIDLADQLRTQAGLGLTKTEFIQRAKKNKGKNGSNRRAMTTKHAGSSFQKLAAL
jgi:hypothetical protein